MKTNQLIIFPLIIIVFSSCTVFRVSEKLSKKDLINEFEKAYYDKTLLFSNYTNAKIETINLNEAEQKLEINLNKSFSFIPFREENVNSIYNEVKIFFGDEFINYNFSIKTLGKDIHELIPNYFRTNKNEYDKARLPEIKPRQNPLVENKSKNLTISNGLYNKNIAIWHSHGWYYNHQMDRWLWQRARLFQTVEDIGPITFTLPYIVPMLENAGANVFLPRERDVQLNEIIIDDKNAIFKSENINNHWNEDLSTGFFMETNTIGENINPFKLGGFHRIKSDTINSGFAEYIPNIPKTGFYGVYISFQSDSNSCDNVTYTVYHLGGETHFQINQKIGGGTWVYLGSFKFMKGVNTLNGKVVISNKANQKGEIITADAVRFGGGMGIVERNGKTSGRPKFVEAARYYLQYSGMPDTLVFNLNENINDYKDDYQSRGEWVNYLFGNPNGPNKNREVNGLGIPIDASIAFHTDAGITKNDTTIGTLLIYSNIGADEENIFPEGYSRLANRDFADIMQTQIVEDISVKYDPIWNRRQLMEAQYSEAVRPNVPSVLLELASHQNFLDVKFLSDPRFKFDVSRSIYKSILKFLSVQHNFEYVVQPLPVTHFSIERVNNNSLKLSWEKQDDMLEPSAVAKGFRLYTRIDDNDFDNGREIFGNSIVLNEIEFDKIYSFKVTAINEGGESFPSEILSACLINNENPTVLIINNFNRVASPYSVNTDLFSGFVNDLDEGVPDKYDIGFTGKQHNFNPNSKWETDDKPGHGASYADYESKIISGNTFDFPFIHGKAIKNNNYSFISASDEAVSDNKINLANYKIIDIIFGEEKSTKWVKPFTDSVLGIQYSVFNKMFMNKIEQFLNNGGNIFISGSYIASDIFLNEDIDSSKINFAVEMLKYKLASERAVKNGNVISIDDEFLPNNFNFSFATSMNDSIYNAEAPDALKPINESKTILRYAENFYSAAIAFKDKYSVVAFGFPFETIKNENKKNIVMKAILKYFDK